MRAKIFNVENDRLQLQLANSSTDKEYKLSVYQRLKKKYEGPYQWGGPFPKELNKNTPVIQEMKSVLQFMKDIQKRIDVVTDSTPKKLEEVIDHINDAEKAKEQSNNLDKNVFNIEWINEKEGYC